MTVKLCRMFVVALALMAHAGGTALAAPEPELAAPPGPQVTVEPTAGLLDGQTVSVSISDLGATYAVVGQCRRDEIESCGGGRYVEADGAGNATIEIDVARRVGELDCGIDRCALVITAGWFDDGVETVEPVVINIGFDTAVAPPPLPSLSVEPTTNLTDRAAVGITVDRLSGESYIDVSLCAHSDIDSFSCVYVGSDFADGPSSRFEVRLPRRLNDGSDCAVERCVVAVRIDGPGSGLRLETEVDFDAKAPFAPSATLRVAPAFALWDGQNVRLFGENHVSNGLVVVRQCAGDGSDLSRCGSDESYLDDAVDSNGDFHGRFVVRSSFSTWNDEEIDCLSERCSIVVDVQRRTAPVAAPIRFDSEGRVDRDSFPQQLECIDWPTTQWPSGPLPDGVDRADLDALVQDDPNRSGQSMVVVHGGEIVYEWYDEGTDASTILPSFSVSKSFTATAIGLLVGDGALELDGPAPVPEWSDPADPRHPISLRDLLHMASGLEWNESYDFTDGDNDIIRMLLSDDVGSYVADKPLEIPPGTSVEYSTGTTMLIARIISQQTGLYGADLEAFLDDHLFAPLGIDEVELNFDSTGVWLAGSTTNTTTRNFAKLGLLYLRGGVWEDEQFLPPEWAEFVRTPAVDSYYGAQFWVEGGGRFRMAGINGQAVYIAPDLDLIVAVNNSGGDQYGAVRLFENAQPPSCDHQPIAVDDRISVAPGATVTIDVLANDPGRGEQLAPATLTIGETPDIGSARKSNAKLVYTAPVGGAATDMMTYVVCTVTRICGEATVEIDIAPIVVEVDASEPARLLDTRAAGQTVDGRSRGSGPVMADQMVEVQIAGRGPVAGDARTAAINLTSVQPSANGFATLYSCDGPPPNASMINFRTGKNIANATIVHLSTSGSICIYSSASTHFIIDTAAWVPADTDIDPFEPERLLDTRRGARTIDGRTQSTGRLRAGEIVEIPVAGRGATPTDATAVVASVIAVGAEADGYATLYPCSDDPPTASTVNFERGQNIANATVVRLSDRGSICAFFSAGSHVVVDVTASVPTSSPMDAFPPERIRDTRDAGRVGAGETIEIPIAGHGSVPEGAIAAVVNLTSIDPLTTGYATLFACDTTPPNVSVLNSAPGTNVANALAVKLSARGSICLYSHNEAHYAVDVLASIT